MMREVCGPEDTHILSIRACRFEGRRARTSDVCMYHSIGKAKCGMINFKSRKSNDETCRVMGVIDESDSSRQVTGSPFE